MRFISVKSIDDGIVIINGNNISHIIEYEGYTRIYLRHVAGATSPMWFIQTRESINAVARRITETLDDR